MLSEDDNALCDEIPLKKMELYLNTSKRARIQNDPLNEYQVFLVNDKVRKFQ